MGQNATKTAIDTRGPRRPLGGQPTEDDELLTLGTHRLLDGNFEAVAATRGFVTTN